MESTATLTTATLKKFLDSVSYARAHNERIMQNLDSSMDIAIKYAQYQLNTLKYETKYIEPVYRIVVDSCGKGVTGGYAVIDEELCGLWSTVKGRGDWLIQAAIFDGAKHLNCFDGYLVKKYKQFGFNPICFEENFEQGGPDVVYMTRDKI